MNYCIILEAASLPDCRLESTNNRQLPYQQDQQEQSAMKLCKNQKRKSCVSEHEQPELKKLRKGKVNS
jgi:hypothetical protein